MRFKGTCDALKGVQFLSHTCERRERRERRENRGKCAFSLKLRAGGVPRFLESF
jgi:hypothetical protein